VHHCDSGVPNVSLRSWLFVPADSERKLAKAATCSADALILDLEDSVAAERKSTARELAREFIKTHRTPGRARLWVRINALATGDAQLDLQALAAELDGWPEGLMIPKVEDPTQLQGLSEQLSRMERDVGMPQGITRLLPVLETPRAILTAPGYLHTPLPRLSGITWGIEDLALALRVRPSDETGHRNFALSGAQFQCLLVARALELDAIETVSPDFNDLSALRAACLRSHADGFDGKLAIHPNQVGVINTIFAPSPADLEHARQVLSAFASADGAGAVALEGKMLDIAHLRAAERLLNQKVN
jgi:citrate lyase subunit beta / citryl-CoA lyase